MDKDKKQIEIYKIIIAVLLTASITFSLTLFGYYHYYDEYSYQNFISDEYYISTLGLPTDEYGFLEL